LSASASATTVLLPLIPEIYTASPFVIFSAAFALKITGPLKSPMNSSASTLPLTVKASARVVVPIPILVPLSYKIPVFKVSSSDHLAT